MLKVSQEIVEAKTEWKKGNDDVNVSMKRMESDLNNMRENIDKFYASLEKNIEKQNKLSSKMKKFSKNEKLDDKLEKLSEKFSGSFEKFEEQIGKNNQKIYMIEEYLDKYMPMKILSTISGTVVPMLNQKNKSKNKNNKAFMESLSVSLHHMINLY